MRIIQDDDERLVARRSNGLAIAVGGLLLAAGLAGIVAGLSRGEKSWIGMGAVGGVVGALVLVFTRSYVINVDSTRREVSVTTRNVFGGESIRTHAFDDVAEIWVEEQVQSHVHQHGQTARPRHTFLLTLRMRDGQLDGADITPSVQTSVFGVSTTRFAKNNAAFALASAIAQRIGVPCSDRRMATFGEIADVAGNLIRAAREPRVGS